MRPIFFAFWGIVTFAMVVAHQVLSLDGNGLAGEAIARLVFVDGEVRTSHEDLPLWRPGKIDAKLTNGARVETGRGRARIEFVDGRRITLENGTSILINGTERNDSLDIAVSLLGGIIDSTNVDSGARSRTLETVARRINSVSRKFTNYTVVTSGHAIQLGSDVERFRVGTGENATLQIHGGSPRLVDLASGQVHQLDIKSAEKPSMISIGALETEYGMPSVSEVVEQKNEEQVIPQVEKITQQTSNIRQVKVKASTKDKAITVSKQAPIKQVSLTNKAIAKITVDPTKPLIVPCVDKKYCFFDNMDVAKRSGLTLGVAFNVKMASELGSSIGWHLVAKEKMLTILPASLPESEAEVVAKNIGADMMFYGHLNALKNTRRSSQLSVNDLRRSKQGKLYFTDRKKTLVFDRHTLLNHHELLFLLRRNSLYVSETASKIVVID